MHRTADLLPFPTPPEREPVPRSSSTQVTEWHAKIEALPADKDSCPGYRQGEWARARATMLEALELFGDHLVRLGWTTAELFAVKVAVGVVHADGCGALVTSDRPVTTVEPSAVVYGPLRSYRGKPGQTYGVPIWAFVWPKVGPKKLGGWQ